MKKKSLFFFLSCGNKKIDFKKKEYVVFYILKANIRLYNIVFQNYYKEKIGFSHFYFDI